MRSLRSFLALYDRGTTTYLAVAAMCTALLSIFDFASLVVLYPVLGAVVGKSGSAAAGPNWLASLSSQTLLILAMILMITRSALGFLVRWWWGRKVARAEVLLSARVLGSYAFAPYQFHLRTNSADLLARAVSHVNIATSSALTGLVVIAGDGMSGIAVACALFLADPTVALTTAIFLGVVGFGISVFTRKFVKAQTATFTRQVAQVYNRASLVLRGIRELTVSNGRDLALAEMDRARGGMARAQRNLLLLNELPRVLLEVLMYSAVLVALFMVLHSSDPGAVLPLVALYVVAGTRILPIAIRVLSTQMTVRSAYEIGEQLTAEMAEISAQGHQSYRSADDLPTVGDLHVQGVSFSYDGGTEVLKSIDLDIPFGSMVGFVGPSGSGKTTLMALILGLLAPSSGRITFGGADIGLSDPDWMSKVAYVPQDVFLMDDTLLANVCIGDDTPSESLAREALTRAHLKDLVDSLPHGLDTGLQEGGARLSVGQRQRVGIARALYRDAKILLLDEPTAALDAVTEAQVMETLNALRGEVTMLIVAHRTSTLAGADQVVSLNGGCLERIS